MESNKKAYSYEKWNIVMTIAALIAFAALIYMIAVNIALLPLTIYVVAINAIFFIADRIEKKRFRQWRKLGWKVPWIPIIILFVIMIVLEFVLTGSQTKFIMFLCVLSLICMTYLIQNAFYVRKYHLDRFASIEEFIKEVPEASEKLRTKLF